MFKELLILSLAAVCLANPVIGACKKPTTVKDFDLEKFAGTWYELETTGTLLTAATKCTHYKVEYKGKNKGSVLHKFYNKVTNKMKSEYSDIKAEKPTEPGKLAITPLKTTSALDTKWTLYVVDTDYENYAIAYSCTKRFLAAFENVYIFSRSKTMDDKQKMDMYDILKKNNLSQKNLVDIPQEDKDCDES